MKRRFLLLFLMVMTLMALVPVAAGNSENAYGVSEEEIAAYPEPAARPLRVDQSLLHDRRYQSVEGDLNVYDAPGGNLIRTIDDGYNFLTTIQDVNGWTEINGGQWAQSAQLTESNNLVSNFSGVLLPEEELPYPMAWVLVNLKPSLEPGGDPHNPYPMTWRYTRVNIYDTVIVNGNEWYQIGVDKWVVQYHVARILDVPRPQEVETERWISIDLYEQVVTAFEGDRPVFATLTSTGQSLWPTNEGLYNIYYRRPRKDMSGGVPGDDYYYLEEVPWTMFFDEGRALHGAFWHDGFGYRRSHGCVNLTITDAEWLYQWVAEDMGTQASADVEVGPAVYVYSSGEY